MHEIPVKCFDFVEYEHMPALDHLRNIAFGFVLTGLLLLSICCVEIVVATYCMCIDKQTKERNPLPHVIYAHDIR